MSPGKLSYFLRLLTIFPEFNSFLCVWKRIKTEIWNLILPTGPDPWDPTRQPLRPFSRTGLWPTCRWTLCPSPYLPATWGPAGTTFGACPATPVLRSPRVTCRTAPTYWPPLPTCGAFRRTRPSRQGVSRPCTPLEASCLRRPLLGRLGARPSAAVRTLVGRRGGLDVRPRPQANSRPDQPRPILTSIPSNAVPRLVLSAPALSAEARALVGRRGGVRTRAGRSDRASSSDHLLFAPSIKQILGQVSLRPRRLVLPSGKPPPRLPCSFRCCSPSTGLLTAPMSRAQVQQKAHDSE
jgi:hypothetical protein